MAFQRNLSPLPEGRYWIHLFAPLAVGRPDARDSFQRWRDSLGSGKVRVETVEDFTDEEPPKRFVIFRVLEPVMGFPAKDTGFPEIIKLGREQPPIEESDVKTSEDTVHDESDEEEEPGAGTQSVKVLVLVGVGLGVTVAAALAWTWFDGKRKGLAARAA